MVNEKNSLPDMPDHIYQMLLERSRKVSADSAMTAEEHREYARQIRENGNNKLSAPRF